MDVVSGAVSTGLCSPLDSRGKLPQPSVVQPSSLEFDDELLTATTQGSV